MRVHFIVVCCVFIISDLTEKNLLNNITIYEYIYCYFSNKFDIINNSYQLLLF